MFTVKQKLYFKKRRIPLSEVNRQLELLKKKKSYLPIVRPALVKDGIFTLGNDQKKYFDNFSKLRRQKKIIKFVPASGAASRMFKDLTAVLKNNDLADAKEYKTYIENFIVSLTNFPFYKKLRNTGDLQEILKDLLTPQGMNYLALPKGLLDFHRYPREIRTAFEEHLIEGIEYIRDAKNTAHFHFTVSPEHKKLFKQELKKIKAKIEKKQKVHINVSFSVQDQRTDTIALDAKNNLFNDETGRPLLRPAGHGALIKNLNLLKGDIVVIRNIDNIAHDHAKETGVEYEQLLLGFFDNIQQKIFKYVKELVIGEYNIEEIRGYIYSMFGLKSVLQKDFNRTAALRILDRPLRVCGMVKNEGEPGGGPYWVKDQLFGESLQIVEKDQISPHQQRSIMSKATHFNPVNIICGLRNYRGKKFDLNNYIDEEAVIVTEKSSGGQTLKALERPGLWNGAMSNWNTVFVEIPIETFTPVKVLNDLLRPEHQPL